MDVILPKYIKSPDFFDEPINLANYSLLVSIQTGTLVDGKSQLDSDYDVTSSEFITWDTAIVDPTTEIWDDTIPYSIDDEVNYLCPVGTRDVGIWKVYKALATNTGQTPPEYGANSYWQDIGAIDKYKPFDYYKNTKFQTEEEYVKITFRGKYLTSFAFINIQAKNLSIRAWATADPTDILLTENMIIVEKTTTYYDYFFKEVPFVRAIAIADKDLYLYNDITIEIILTGFPDIGTYCGMLIPGIRHDIGSLQYGVSTGIKDYSRKITDEFFGETSLKPGNYKDTMSADLIIMNYNKNTVNNILRQLRATPTVFQGNQYDSEFDDFLIYGFIQDFNIIHSGYDYCEANLELEGLI